MRKTMTLAVAALMMCCTQKAMAQERLNEGTWGGVRVGYGTRIENPGVGVAIHTWVADWARVQVGLDYFFKKNGDIDLGNSQMGSMMWERDYSLYDLTADIDFVVPLKGKVQPYALAGFAVAAWNVNSSMDTHIGSSLGAGIDVRLAPKARLGLEWHHHIVKDYGQSVFSLCASFAF